MIDELIKRTMSCKDIQSFNSMIPHRSRNMFESSTTTICSMGYYVSEGSLAKLTEIIVMYLNDSLEIFRKT